MKRLFSACCLIIIASAASAQIAPPPEEMEALSPLVGVWEGEGWFRMGPGEPEKFKQTEEVRVGLNGHLLHIAGTGMDLESGEVVFLANAVVDWDDSLGEYRFHAWTGRGDYVEADAEVGEHELNWWFETPQGQTIRYHLKFADDVWHETGEIEMGEQTHPFFEMTLHRKK